MVDNPHHWSRALGRWLAAGFGLALLLLASFALSTLRQWPCVGVADNLDFGHVMHPAGIEHTSDLTHPGYYTRCTFQTQPAQLRSGPSSSAFLAWVARHVTWGAEPAENTLDLRQMGMLNVAVLMLFLFGALFRGAPFALTCLVLYVIVDPGYLLFFNSFYADATLIVALAGTSLWLATGVESRSRTSALSWTAAVTLLALLGGGSKMQYVVFPAILWLTLGLVALPSLFIRSHRAPVHFGVTSVALVVVSLAVGWSFFLDPGPRFQASSNYHAVYGGILRVASDPPEVLADLAVPVTFWDLPRTDAWSAGVDTDHPVHPHLASLSRRVLLGHYLRDPGARSRTMDEIAGHLTRVESHPHGTRVRQPGHHGPVSTLAVSWQFSKMTRTLLARHPPIVWWGMGIAAAWLLLGVIRRQWTGLHTAELFLLAWSTCQIAIVVSDEGLVNLHQRLLGARLGLDLLAVFLVVHGAQASGRWLANRP